jgi:hypothetical protein
MLVSTNHFTLTIYATLSVPVGATLTPPTVVQMFGLLVPNVACMMVCAAKSKGTIVELGWAASDGHMMSPAIALAVLSASVVPARYF